MPAKETFFQRNSKRIIILVLCVVIAAPFFYFLFIPNFGKKDTWRVNNHDFKSLKAVVNQVVPVELNHNGVAGYYETNGQGQQVFVPDGFVLRVTFNYTNLDNAQRAAHQTQYLNEYLIGELGFGAFTPVPFWHSGQENARVNVMLDHQGLLYDGKVAYFGFRSDIPNKLLMVLWVKEA